MPWLPISIMAIALPLDTALPFLLQDVSKHGPDDAKQSHRAVIDGHGSELALASVTSANPHDFEPEARERSK